MKLIQLGTLRLLILFLLLFLQIEKLHAGDSPKPSWAVVLDAYNDCDIADVVVDNKGYTFAAFNYMGTIAIKGLKAKTDYAEHMHGGIIRIDPHGKPVWVRTFNSAYDNRIREISLDVKGDLLVTGYGDGLMRFPGINDSIICGRAKGSNEYHQPHGEYLARYTPEGEVQWVKYLMSPWGEGISVSSNSRGEIFWSLYGHGTLFDGEELLDSGKGTNHNKAMIYLARLNSGGKLIELKRLDYYNTSTTNIAPEVRIDKEDNVYLFGLFKKVMHFSETDSLTNDGYYDAHDSYLVKYNPDLELQWMKKIGGHNTQHLRDLTFGSDNSVYATGSFSYECLIGDGMGMAHTTRIEYKSGYSFFYFRMYPDGELAFVNCKTVTDRYNATFTGQSIAFDENGETHIIGMFTDTVNFNGFKIAARDYPGYMFFSRWNEDKLIDLQVVAKTEKGFILPNSYRINNSFFASSAMYHGPDVSLEIAGKQFELGSLDYGRASVVYGGRIKLWPKPDTVLLASRHIRRRNIELLKPIIACIKPEQELTISRAVWYPSNDSMPQSRETWVAGNPCGREVQGKEALLFPNPAIDRSSLKLIGLLGGLTRMDVFSETGQLLFTRMIEIKENEHLVSLDMPDAPAGVYYIRVIHGGFEKALRLILIDG
jgi:hypothetical protein